MISDLELSTWAHGYFYILVDWQKFWKFKVGSMDWRIFAQALNSIILIWFVGWALHYYLVPRAKGWSMANMGLCNIPETLGGKVLENNHCYTGFSYPC